MALRLYPAFLASFQDPDHYYHLRLSESFVANGGIPEKDELSNQGSRPYTYYPAFHLLVASTAILFSSDALAAYAFVSLLAGALSTLAIFVASRLLLQKTAYSESAAIYASAFAAAAPAFFLRQTVFSRPDAFAAGLAALVLAFLLKKSGAGMAVVAAFMVLLHPYSAAVITALTCLAISIDYVSHRLFCKSAFFEEDGRKAKEADRKLAALLAVYFIAAAMASAYYLRLPLERLSFAGTFRSSSELKGTGIAELLALYGGALVFAAVAALRAFGMPDKPKLPALYGLCGYAAGALALLPLALRNFSYSAAAVAVLAGAGLEEAWKKSGKFAPWLWAIAATAVIVTAYAGLSSQGGAYSPQQLAGFAYLKTLENSSVIALWDRGHAITYLAAKPVVEDGYFEFEPRLDEKTRDIGDLFGSKEAGTAYSIASKYDARYVFVDNKTRSVFGGAENGFTELFGKANGGNGSAKKLFDSGDAQIYELNA